ncbi:unnamed protein product [Sphagnum troendelagicum]|uniref:Uncharacterized protein n=1 Tax=Sphagnum troendelagicum TaxID=128251 RepID=A0ABP0UAR5_9BRYO
MQQWCYSHPSQWSIGNPALLEAAVSSDLGIAWSKDSVAHLFASHMPQAANLYKTPSSLVLVTADRSGAVPETAKVKPVNAAVCS